MAETAETTTQAQQSAGRRDRTAVAQRVLIVGLDGATFDVLGPMMRAGRMPRLQRFIEGGASGVLRSTTPPITPAAWTTCMTGKGPGLHGIIDFERYDVRTNALRFNSTQCLSSVRTIWQILGDKGFAVGSVNVPMTYPPTPVNGFMISGFETPSINTNFAYPPQLKQEILERFPDYSFKTRWRRKTFGGDDLFARNLDYIKRSFHQGAELTRFCGDRYGWDVLMVVLKLVDNLQHKTWRYLDERTRGRDPHRAELTAACFNELDAAVGSLLDYADEHNAHVVMVSDHGHGSLEGKIQPNLMLRRWGYLALKGRGTRIGTRLQHQLDRWTKRRKGKFAAGSFSLARDLAVDFSRTRAAVMHAGMNGFLYINLKGRQETGIVDPADYEPLRDELRDRLLAETCRTPDGRSIKLFPEVHKPEELYGCEREGREWLPDLLLVPAEALAVVRKIRGLSPVSWLPHRQMEGTHRVNGIFAAGGPGVAAGKTTDSDIVNVTPTVLAMMGLNVPDDMEGRVMTDIFETPIEVGIESAAEMTAPTSDDAVYSAKDEDDLTQRLRDLGYLE